MSSDGNRISPTLVLGVLIVLVGVALLLDRAGVIHAANFFSLWPAVLVIVGITKLLNSCGTSRIFGALLILAGVLLQLETAGYIHLQWDYIWPAGLIVGGLLLMWRAIRSRREGTSSSLSSSSASRLMSFGIFGGGEHHVDTKNFKGGDLLGIFGGFEVDLTHADMEGDSAVIDANAIFGGGEIRVPESWTVTVQGVGIFGGYENSTQRPQQDQTGPRKNLIVRGVAIFGGVEVKN